MSQQDRIAEIESMSVKEFKEEIQATIDNLQRGIRPGHTIELLAAALNMGMLGEDLKTALERWLQFDLWESVNKSQK